MSNPLLEKLRRSRETNAQIGGFTFVIRRPTQYQLSEIPDNERSNYQSIDPETGEQKTIRIAKDEAMLRRFVVDWKDVKEIDIVPGGDPIPATFTVDLLIEWLQDKAELWRELSTAVWSVYMTHKEEVSESVGESNAGSSGAS